MNRHTVRRLAGGRLNQLSKVLRRRGILTIAAVRLVPVAPFVVVGLIAGAIRIHPWHYVGGTFLGMLPGMLGATVFGDQLQTALRDPSQINYGILVAVALAIVVLTLCVRHWLAGPRSR